MSSTNDTSPTKRAVKFEKPKTAISTVSGGSADSSAAPSAAPSAASRPASRPAPSAAPKPAAAKPAAAKPAAAKKEASTECKAFNSRVRCTFGARCRDPRCITEQAKYAKPSAPAKAAAGGDGGIAKQLAAMESRINSRLDALSANVTTGFEETKVALSAQEKASLGMQEAMMMLMRSSASFQDTVKGFISSGSTPHRELTSSASRRAICDSSATEVAGERRSAKSDSASAASEGDDKLTGADMDIIMSFLASLKLEFESFAYKCILDIAGKDFSDHHKTLLTNISKHTKDDASVALLFMLMTGSEQFRKGSFKDFREACTTLLGANRAGTQEIFSKICIDMIKSNSTWEVKKSGTIKASNTVLKEPSNHKIAFDALVTNFKN
jgi:hypothetical protein